MVWDFARVDAKFKEVREKKRKKMVNNVKLEIFFVHALHHRVESIEIFQMSP
jgi:hypothetical protein